MLRNPLPKRRVLSLSRPGAPVLVPRPPSSGELPAIATPAVSVTSMTGSGLRAVLPHRAVFPLLGVPVEVRTNSLVALAAAERTFGGWRALQPERVEARAPLILRVIVQPGRPWEVRPTSFVTRAHGDCYLASAESNLLSAHRDRGEALAFVTPELAGAGSFFRRNVLECLAMLLVGKHDRTPLPAAALVRNGRTILLAGPGGIGKSTLCRAALKAGWALLADEVVHVSARDGLRMWGCPWELQLTADAGRFFPELADRSTELQPNGKLKFTVDVAALGTDRLALVAGRPVVCQLQRQRRLGSSLERIDPSLAADALTQPGESGFEFHPETRELALRLAGEAAYRLTLGTDLASAIRRLHEVAEG